MIRRLFIQSLGLSWFGLTFPISDSRATKYLDKNLIIVSKTEIESMMDNRNLLFIPQPRIYNRTDLISRMKKFVDICTQYNFPIATNVYGLLNENREDSHSIIAYGKSSTFPARRG